MPRITSRAEIREFYDDSADSYSTMMDDEIDLPMYAELLGGLAGRISNLDGAILDSSCGSGHILEQLKDTYVPGRRFHGIDLSPRMVAISQQRLGNAATIAEGDMAELHHLLDDSCAAVLNFFALHHVDLKGMLACFMAWHPVWMEAKVRKVRERCAPCQPLSQRQGGRRPGIAREREDLT